MSVRFTKKKEFIKHVEGGTAEWRECRWSTVLYEVPNWKQTAILLLEYPRLHFAAVIVQCCGRGQLSPHRSHSGIYCYSGRSLANGLQEGGRASVCCFCFLRQDTTQGFALLKPTENSMRGPSKPRKAEQPLWSSGPVRCSLGTLLRSSCRCWSSFLSLVHYCVLFEKKFFLQTEIGTLKFTWPNYVLLTLANQYHNTG